MQSDQEGFYRYQDTNVDGFSFPLYLMLLVLLIFSSCLGPVDPGWDYAMTDSESRFENLDSIYIAGDLEFQFFKARHFAGWVDVFLTITAASELKDSVVLHPLLVYFKSTFHDSIIRTPKKVVIEYPSGYQQTIEWGQSQTDPHRPIILKPRETLHLYYCHILCFDFSYSFGCLRGGGYPHPERNDFIMYLDLFKNDTPFEFYFAREQIQ